MTLTASGLFSTTFVDVFDLTQLAIDLDSETQTKVALFTNSTTTPNFTTNTAYGAAPFNANEVTGTAYTAGGQTLTTTTFTAASNVSTFDGADLTWAASTITGARGALVYAGGLGSLNALALVTLGADYSTSAGSLVIQWSASGIFNFTLA